MRPQVGEHCVKDTKEEEEASVNKRFGKVRGSCTVTNARARPASTGYTKEACTGRRRRYSNGWMMRASLLPRCCDTFHTGPRLTSSVTSAMSDYQSTATNFNGRHDTCH